MSLKKLKQKLKEESTQGAQWFCQDYVPYLRRFGEWRVFFINGKYQFTVLTEPDEATGELQCAPLANVWTLEELT